MRKRSPKRRWRWKRYDLALAEIDRALETNPSDADNWAYRGAILMWAGRSAEALPWLEGALRSNPANGFAAGRLCMVYYLSSWPA